MTIVFSNTRSRKCIDCEGQFALRVLGLVVRCEWLCVIRCQLRPIRRVVSSGTGSATRSRTAWNVGHSWLQANWC